MQKMKWSFLKLHLISNFMILPKNMTKVID